MKPVSMRTLNVSAQGLGCMGMSWGYGKRDDTASLRTLGVALELGVHFWDTAQAYGDNELLLARALKGNRDKVVLATKFGFALSKSGAIVGLDGSADNAKRACDASLKRLGVDHIDLFYLHRRDKNVPIEDTVGAMRDLVLVGKVRELGLSEVSSTTLRAACAVHPIAALQSEYSLWERQVETDILPTCRALGVTFVAYSPLGRGFLTSARPVHDTLAKDDNRRRFPRFSPEHHDANLTLAQGLEAIAQSISATPAQVSLAWLQAQGVVAIPGTKQEARLRENWASTAVVLSAATLEALAALFPIGAASGARYHEGAMKMLDG
jgi:aryl-alcohol dehydrogenase-like predicted oxidoreductase